MLTEDDKTAVRVLIADAVAGSFVPAGLTDFEVTTIEVSDVETLLPITPLTGRKSMMIYNTDADHTLYFGKMGVEANDDLGTSAGWEIQPSSALNIDLAADAVDIYGITETGVTIKVKLFEIA